MQYWFAMLERLYVPFRHSISVKSVGLRLKRSEFSKSVDNTSKHPTSFFSLVNTSPIRRQLHLLTPSPAYSTFPKLLLSCIPSTILLPLSHEQTCGPPYKGHDSVTALRSHASVDSSHSLLAHTAYITFEEKATQRCHPLQLPKWSRWHKLSYLSSPSPSGSPLLP